MKRIHSRPCLRSLVITAGAFVTCGLFATLAHVAVWAQSASVRNLTGLPLYPNLRQARMDEVSRTDTLGRWCSRFAASSADALPVVEEWYRKALLHASETDLTDDARYQAYPNLVGIKLARGIDYVTVFRSGDQSITSIELFRCSPLSR